MPRAGESIRPERITVNVPKGTREQLADYAKPRRLAWSAVVSEALRRFWEAVEGRAR